MLRLLLCHVERVFSGPELVDGTDSQIFSQKQTAVQKCELPIHTCPNCRWMIGTKVCPAKTMA